MIFKPQRKLNQRGIALMLVLSAVAILTTAVVEFAYGTNVALHLAQNERERLQAAYLAKSAYAFMLLELKYDRVFRQVVQQQNLGQLLRESANLPLCQQFPLSTGLIRLLFLSEEGQTQLPDELKKSVSLSEEAGALKFLDFDGDFDGECIDEATKFNLNAFALYDPDKAAEGRPNAYHAYKQQLLRFLKKKEFSLLFETADVRPEEALHRIADWVDANEVSNEGEGKGSGSELAPYDRAGVAYKVRNNKFLTPTEIYQVAGVKDDWFATLDSYFTIYGDGKVNICTAKPEIVTTLIIRYVETTPDLPPVRLEDPEVMERLMKAVGEGCTSGAVGDQLVDTVATKLSAAINVDNEPGLREPSPQQPTGNPPPAGQSGGLREMVTGTARFFRLNLTGQIQDTTVRITAVVDTQDSDPSKWPLLYWRVY